MVGEAKAELQQALEIDPDFVAARLLLTQMYFDLGRYERVQEEAGIALARHPGQSQFLVLLAEAERRLGHAPRALELVREALRSAPTSPQAHYYLGLALIDGGQRDEGVRELEQLVKAGPNPPEVYLSLGTAYLDAGRFDDAVSTLEQGTRIAPAMTDLHIALARAYRSKGSLTLAEQQITLAGPPGSGMEVTPAWQRTETARNLEWGLLRMQQGQLAAAVGAFRQAIGMDPDSGPAHRGLAEVYVRQGQYDKAREEAAIAASLGAPLSAEAQRALDAHPAAPGARP
jgi:tetratricopeptide (TPR) repeat protein